LRAKPSRHSDPKSGAVKLAHRDNSKATSGLEDLVSRGSDGDPADGKDTEARPVNGNLMKLFPSMPKTF